MQTFSTPIMDNVTTSYPGDNDDVTRYRYVMNVLLTYLPPVIIAIGTVGNLLSVILLSRRRMRSKSVYFYLLLLAVADTFVLYMNAFRTWFRTVWGWELYMHHSDAVCKAHMFVMEVALHMSAWLVVLVTADRFVAVTYPLRAASLCTSRRAVIHSLLTLLLLAGYQAHVFWTYRLQEIPGRRYCGPVPGLPFMSHGYHTLRLATYCLIPFLLVLVLNTSIILLMRRRNNTNAHLFRAPGNTSSDDVTRMTRMLLLVSFTWLVLSGPFTLISVLPSSIVFGATPGERARGWLVKAVCFLLLWTNHACNFYLYCLSGKRLRASIADLVCCRRSQPERAGSVMTSAITLRAQESIRNGKNHYTEVTPL